LDQLRQGFKRDISYKKNAVFTKNDEIRKDRTATA
jgi:hypothetical protein